MKQLFCLARFNGTHKTTTRLGIRYILATRQDTFLLGKYKRAKIK